MRTLTLADTLKLRGAETSFICNRIPSPLSDLVQRRGHRLEVLDLKGSEGGTSTQKRGESGVDVAPWRADAFETLALATSQGWDWMVVDHYGLDALWEAEMRAVAQRILVIDDLCDRPHDCDLLVDQNRPPKALGGYEALVSERARVLLGPTYALVAPAFSRLRPDAVNKRAGRLKNVLIFMGGSDPVNETRKALAGVSLARDKAQTDWKASVVAGGSNPHLEALQAHCGQLSWVNLHVQTEEMASLMLTADLAIAAGGTNTWERCTLGLPALTTVVADNQWQGSTWVAAAGAQQLLGWWEDLSPETYSDALLSLTAEAIAAMSQSALGICDGGGAARVAQEVIAFDE